MASKKAASKKKASPARKKSGKPGKVPLQVPDLTDDWKCNPPNICRYLEKLSDWLKYQFLPDYTALRIAVCNVEKQAFAGAGINAKPPKFCTGGAGNEPAPPPPPPVW